MTFYRISFQCFIFILLVSSGISCSEDVSQENVIPQQPTSVIGLTEAKAWFEAYAISSNPNIGGQGIIAPRWDKAVLLRSTAEMPFTVGGKLQLPHSELSPKFQGRKRLLINKGKKGYSAHVISYIPSNEFKGDIKKINSANFKAMKFDGKVVLQDLTTGLMRIMSFIQGRQISSSKAHKPVTKTGMNARIQEDYCNIYTEWFEECTDWYHWNGSEWVQDDPTCDYVGYVDATCYDDPYDDCAGYDWEWCGSGGGGGNSGDATIVQEISNALQENPTLLLEIPCGQLPKWQNIAQSDAPQSIKNKINQLQAENSSFDDWAIQTLNGANGTIVNMDYFSVSVSTLPNNPATNAPFTPEAFLDYFRKNINDFVDGSTFSPYCETTPALCSQETNLWNSNDPTGAIIYIDIPGDDGVVVCSEYSSSSWYFMTLEAPGAGNHPVSGTRQFGFEPNGNGGYNFFVRGVDRFDSNLAENALYMTSIFIDAGNPFFGADNLWGSFQNKVNEFINSNGGNAQVNEAIKNRPDWQKVRDVLEGKRPISDLGCK